MYKSIALIDRLSGVMDPEELSQLGVLVDWAEDHGYYPEELIAPVVGEAAGWVYDAYLSLSDVRSSQASVAGLTLDVRVRILEAASEVPAAMGVCARWDAAVAAAEGLPCAPWAAVADVAMLLGWCQSRDLLCYIVMHGSAGASRAARAVMMLRDGVDPMDAWDGE